MSKFLTDRNYTVHYQIPVKKRGKVIRNLEYSDSAWWGSSEMDVRRTIAEKFPHWIIIRIIPN
jgi:hypothetical protein